MKNNRKIITPVTAPSPPPNNTPSASKSLPRVESARRVEGGLLSQGLGVKHNTQPVSLSLSLPFFLSPHSFCKDSHLAQGSNCILSRSNNR